MKAPRPALMILALSAALAAPVFAATTSSTAVQTRGTIERAEAKAAQDLLARSVEYFEKNGAEKSFAAFNDRKGMFVNGPYYVYVVGMDGMMHANGGAPETLAGKNALDLTDAAGKPLIRDLLKQAGKSDTGAIEYLWRNPSDNRVENKTAVYRKVGAHVLAVGYYIVRSSPEEARDLLDRAVAQMKQSGAVTAYKAFNDPHGKFVRGDLYVFAIGLNDGKFRAFGVTPQKSGQDASALKDATGKPLVKEMIALAKNHGSGSIDYVWRNPATNAVEPKHSLVQRVDNVLLGVGYYQKQ